MTSKHCISIHMFEVLQNTDNVIVQLVNQKWTHPGLDAIFSFISNKDYMVLPFVALMVWIWVKGTLQHRIAIILSICSIILGDLIGEQLKQFFVRPRPYLNPDLIETIRVLGGKSSNSPSFPSNHAINCWAMAVPIFVYCRQRFKWIATFFVAFAVAVIYSRIYLGVHYMTDVLAGSAIGVITGSGLCLLHKKLPLCQQTNKGAPLNWGWLSLTILITVILLGLKFSFLCDRNIDLSFEEAQYWDWSRHLDWGYFSKPPMVAWIIYLFTDVIGWASALWVRMPAVVISLILIICMWKFMGQLGCSQKTRFFAFLFVTFTPLFTAGAMLITTDTPLLLGWVCALIALWNALYNPKHTLRSWMLCGFFMGFGLLSKYSMFYFHICLLLMLACTPSLRSEFRKKGVWIACAISLLMLMPPLYWNWSHDWVTFHHVASDATDRGHIGINPLFFFDFIGSQTGVAGPGLFIGGLWLAWHYRRKLDTNQKFLLWFALPIILGFALKSFTSKVQGNWIAMVYPSLTIFVVITWQNARESIETSLRNKKRLTIAGIVSLLIAVPMTFAVYYPLSIFDTAGDLLMEPCNDTDIVEKPYTSHHKIGRSIQGLARPLMGWKEMGRLVSETRKTMPDPSQTRIITTNYQWAAEMAFYVEGQPQTLVCEATRRSQYDIWGGFENAIGHDAIIITGRKMCDLMSQTLGAFERVEPIGPINITYHDYRLQTCYMYKCYNMLRMPPANENAF